MKTKAKFLLCFAATCFAFVGAAHAQLLTYQTLNPDPGPPAVVGYSGSVDTFNSTTRVTEGEVFTNVLAIDSLTYNLFTTGSPAASTLNATFGQWNTTTNAFVGTTLSWSGISVPAYTEWTTFGGGSDLTYQLAFDITALNGSLYTTNPNLSYAFMLTKASGGSNLGYGIGKADQQSDFAYGYGLILNSSGAVNSVIGTDFTFSQIVITPYVAPTPEAGTVASIAGAFLVAGLVGFRLRQRRQLAPVAVAAA